MTKFYSILRRGAVWFLMLSKRLLLRKSFIALLLVIPLFSALVGIASREESGVRTVALFAAGGEDEISQKIVSDLSSSDSVVRFIVCEGEAEAKEKVVYGRADEAWILPEGMDRLVEQYASGADVKLASVYTSGDSPLDSVVRERLNEELFRYTSRAILLRFSEKEVSERIGDADPDEINRRYDEAAFKNDIVEFEQLGTSRTVSTDSGYLSSAVRGIAYLSSVLCTLASALFCMEDETKGFFSRIPGTKRFLIIFASNLSASVISTVVVLPSLAASGVFTSFRREAAAGAVFALASASFATLLCRLAPTPAALGALIPPAALVMAVVCPVFISLSLPARPEMLFPVTYAVRAVRTPRYIAFALVYSAFALAFAVLADRVRRRSR